MPLEDGSSQDDISDSIAELHTGKQYAKTKLKYGAKIANKQAVAISLKKSGKYNKRPSAQKLIGTKL
jgi:hypothetical protein